MKAVKGNKEYAIGEPQKKAYQDAGYDIVDDTGNVIVHGRSKTVPYGEYAALQKENEELRKRLSEAGESAGASAKKGRAAEKAGG